MNWSVLVPLIASYGLPFAEKMWRLFAIDSAPTEADWAELRALAAQTAHTQMADALARAGVDPNSPEGKALLALTGKTQ